MRCTVGSLEADLEADLERVRSIEHWVKRRNIFGICFEIQTFRHHMQSCPTFRMVGSSAGIESMQVHLLAIHLQQLTMTWQVHINIKISL